MIRPPKGWRWLRTRVLIKKGDMFELSPDNWTRTISAGKKTGYFIDPYTNKPCRYIRRITRKHKGKK